MTGKPFPGKESFPGQENLSLATNPDNNFMAGQTYYGLENHTWARKPCMDMKTFPGNENISQGDVRILFQSGDTFQAENLPNVFLGFDLVGW